MARRGNGSTAGDGVERRRVGKSSAAGRSEAVPTGLKPRAASRGRTRFPGKRLRQFRQRGLVPLRGARGGSARGGGPSAGAAEPRVRPGRYQARGPPAGPGVCAEPRSGRPAAASSVPSRQLPTARGRRGGRNVRPVARSGLLVPPPGRRSAGGPGWEV